MYPTQSAIYWSRQTITSLRFAFARGLWLAARLTVDGILEAKHHTHKRIVGTCSKKCSLLPLFTLHCKAFTRWHHPPTSR